MVPWVTGKCELKELVLFPGYSVDCPVRGQVMVAQPITEPVQKELLKGSRYQRGRPSKKGTEVCVEFTYAPVAPAWPVSGAPEGPLVLRANRCYGLTLLSLRNKPSFF